MFIAGVLSSRDASGKNGERRRQHETRQANQPTAVHGKLGISHSIYDAFTKYRVAAQKSFTNAFHLRARYDV
jgi:hypothetical protein